MIREQYARWKELCHELFPVVGSGRYITSPFITEEGQPVQDPVVIMQANPGEGPIIPQEGGDSQNGLNAPNSLEWLKEPLDQKIIQWMLTLHQIGMFSLSMSRIHPRDLDISVLQKLYGEC